MKYLLLSLLAINCVYSQWDYDHVPLDELTKIESECYYDNQFRLYVKYNEHWYEMGATSHHVLCPCYQVNDYKGRKSLSQELSGY